MKAFPRQALHAEALSLIHPESQGPRHWQKAYARRHAGVINPHALLRLVMFTPDWPAPVQVRRHYTHTQCLGPVPGFSQPPYGQFNLATHVGEAPSGWRPIGNC